MRLPVRLALALAPALPLFAACGPGDSAPPPAAAGGSTISPLYPRGNCHTCHGPALQGTQLGPALGDLTEHWNQASMVEYLSDPQGVTDRTPRLRERRGLYMMRMPPASQAGLSKDDIAALAAWLLSPDRQP